MYKEKIKAELVENLNMMLDKLTEKHYDASCWLHMFETEIDFLNCFYDQEDNERCNCSYDFLWETFIPAKFCSNFGEGALSVFNNFGLNEKTIRKYNYAHWNIASLFPGMCKMKLILDSKKKVEK